AGVSRSSHLLRALQTWVRVVSVFTSRPRLSSESSFPGGGVGCIGPSIPHSESTLGVSSLAQLVQIAMETRIASLCIWPRRRSTFSAERGPRDLAALLIGPCDAGYSSGRASAAQPLNSDRFSSPAHVGYAPSLPYLPEVMMMRSFLLV